MGYYSHFDLSVKPVEPQDIVKLHNVILSKDLIAYVFDDGHYFEYEKIYHFSSWDEQKWYDSEQDMLEISKQLPDMTFKLHCLGEDGEDWLNYYHNGVSETCRGQMVYEEPKLITWP